MHCATVVETYCRIEADKTGPIEQAAHKQSLSYHRVITDCRAFWTIIVLSIIELQQITGLFAIPPLFGSTNLNGDAFTLKCHGIVWTEMHLRRDILE